MTPPTTSRRHGTSPTPRRFPNPVAVYSDTFVFTTLAPVDVASHEKVPFGHPSTGKACTLFSLDEDMHYTAFSQDYGPFNLAYTFKACLRIHDRFRAKEGKSRTLCVYTHPGSKRKANIAMTVALYFLIVWHFDPSSAFQPLAHLELRTFRDAGNGPMDFGLSIQDILWGVHKASTLDLLDLQNFDPRHYQYYEQVDNGDLNILGSFIPFASPMDPLWIEKSRRINDGEDESAIAATNSMINTARSRRQAYECVLRVFQEENVGLIVRLNEDLYDRQTFLDLGIDHVDLYFDDGSNPSDEIVERFIGMAEAVIEGSGRRVAVHCKAGLGRTGVLIGAYLIYKYHFTAAEVIGYMRLIRPGMVVGPQQQYMVVNQMKWVGWAARDQLVKHMARHTIDPVNPLATPPMECDDPLLPPVTECLSSEAEVADLLTSRLGQDTLAVELMPTPTEPVEPSHKGGDAVGQPRKAPARPIRGEEYNLDVPMPEVEIRVKTASPITAPEDTSGGSGSMRGIKRGATRLPISTSSSSSGATDGSSGLRLAIPKALSRSGSNSSLASSMSANERPAKRRGVPDSSPLSSRHTQSSGLSSPLSSRESSPADVPPPPAESRIPRSPSRIPNKLKRRVTPTPSTKADAGSYSPSIAPSSPPPTAIPRFDSMRAQQAHSTQSTNPRRPSTSGPIAEPALTTRKSLLPIRRVPAKDPRPTDRECPRAGSEDRDIRKVRPTESKGRRAMDLQQEDLHPDRAHGQSKRMGGLTPPRFAREFISRIGSVGPSGRG